MRRRCHTPDDAQFHYYGGRGITVCERWHVFENFLADMGECPPGHSIERIDNDGNYEPGNCRWIKRERQMNNTRRSVWIEWRGKRQTSTDWAHEFGVHPMRFRYLQKIRGLPMEDVERYCRLGIDDRR
jgi:hypothetical protein